MAILAQPTSPTHNITPKDLSQEQDMLLLAGSKLSFREIYAQEIDLPLVKGKYYSAKDVDNLFVVLNGVLTSISEQAFRNDKALSSARESVSSAEKDVDAVNDKYSELEMSYTKVVHELESVNQQLLATNDQLSNVSHDDNSDLMSELASKSDDYTRLLESTSVKMTEQSTQIEDLADENENLKLQLDSVINELQELSGRSLDTGLQSELNMLQYKYETLKTLSTQRIQELQMNK